MDSDTMCESGSGKEVLLDFQPIFRIYKDRTADRLEGTDIVPPGDDDQTGVRSKDVVVSPQTGLSVRLFIPPQKGKHRLPIAVYVHGGSFVTETPASPVYHKYFNTFTSKARTLTVGVDFRRPPEVSLLESINDVWAVLDWIASHAGGEGTEPWLLNHGQFDKISVVGECTGGIISHAVALKAAEEALPNEVKIYALVLVDTAFSGSKAVAGEDEETFEWTKQLVEATWKAVNPGSVGLDDPLLNPLGPLAAPLEKLGCQRILLCAAEKSTVKQRTWEIYCKWKKSQSWSGPVEYWETDSEDYLFHLYDPDCEESTVLFKRIAVFLKGGPSPPINRRSSHGIF